MSHGKAMITADVRFSKLAITAVTVLIGLFSFVVMGVKGYIMFMMGLCVIMVSTKPRILLTMYWFYALWSPFLLNYISFIRELRYIDEVITVSMLVVLVIHILLREPSFIEYRSFLRPLFVMLFLLVLSAFANRVPKLNVVKFTLTYCRFAVLFLYAGYFLGNNGSRMVYITMIVTFLMQIALNVGWLLGISFLPNLALGGPDFAVGTGVSANNIAYFMIVFFVLELSFLTCQYSSQIMESRKGTFVTLVFMVLALFQLVLTFTLHAYILLIPVVGFFIFFFTKGRYKFRIVVAIIMCIPFVPLVLRVPVTGRSIRIDEVLTVDAIKKRVDDVKYGAKGTMYRNVFYHAMKDLPFPVLGAGPGNFASSTAMDSNRPLTERYIPLTFINMYGATVVYRGSITSYPNAGYTAIWGDLGPLGFIFYWGLHLLVVGRVWRQIKMEEYETFYQHVLALAFIPCMFLYLGLNLLLDFASLLYVSNGIWIWAAAVWAPVQQGSLTPTEEDDQISLLRENVIR